MECLNPKPSNCLEAAGNKDYECIPEAPRCAERLKKMLPDAAESARPRNLIWVAVRELQLSYHNGCIYIYKYSNQYVFPNIVINLH